MELVKHRNHRNPDYLEWLRTQKCVVSGKKAEAAHHVRLGTNGGQGLKPSDYFCIPLLNEYHTTGLWALHYVGEKTFLEKFNLVREDMWIDFLNRYLIEKFKIKIDLKEGSDREKIAFLIEQIEANRDNKKKSYIVKKNYGPASKHPSNTEYYERAKELKRTRDKELREQLKQTKIETTPKVSITENEFYQRAKEEKKKRDKELRDSLKQQSKSAPAAPKMSDNPLYQKAKEEKKRRDKELRAKLKEEAKRKRNGTQIDDL